MKPPNKFAVKSTAVPESVKDAGRETPPLSRHGRKVADATLAAAQFKLTPDGKNAVRQFEVHGIAVTEEIGAAYVMPIGTPVDKPAGENSRKASVEIKEPTPQTPPLTRVGRKEADAKLMAAKFIPSSDGKNAMRKFEVHGMAVTEYISADKAADAIRDKK